MKLLLWEEGEKGKKNQGCFCEKKKAEMLPHQREGWESPGPYPCWGAAGVGAAAGVETPSEYPGVGADMP